jgi:hypothetical protein
VGDRIDSDISAGATPVLYDDGLAPYLRQPVGDDAGGCVGSAARRESNQKSDYSSRPSLRASDAGGDGERGCTRCQMQKSTARKFHGRLEM